MSEAAQYNIILSNAALSMLECHVDLMARKNPAAASKLVDAIMNDLSLLTSFPECFLLYRNQFITDNRYRKIVSARRYLIFYEIDGTNVYVDHIIDCKQEGEWLLESL